MASGESTTIRDRSVDLAGDLVIAKGGRLVLRDAYLTVHGSLVVHGAVESFGSEIRFVREGQPRGLDVIGGTFRGQDIVIVDADAIKVREGASMDVKHATLLYGQLTVEDGDVDWSNVTTEAIEPIDDAGALARHQVKGRSQVNITDSIASGSWHAVDPALVGFLNTSVAPLALTGSGEKQVAYRLHVEAHEADGGPAAARSIELLSVPAARIDARGLTDLSGRVTLTQVLAVVRDTWQTRDPHVILVDGRPMGASQAITGDQSMSVLVI